MVIDYEKTLVKKDMLKAFHLFVKGQGIHQANSAAILAMDGNILGALIGSCESHRYLNFGRY